MPTGASGTLSGSADWAFAIEDGLDAPLDLADVVEIAVDADAVGGGQPSLQRDRLLANRIENAAVLALAREALLGRAAVAKELFEHRLRAVFHRQRHRRRAPGNRVEVGAAVAGAAAQAGFFDAQLERRQRRVLADVLGGDLIHRHADTHGVFLRTAAAEEDGRRARVLGAGVGAGGAGVHEVADHGHVIAILLERAESLRELEPAPSAAGVHLAIVAPCGT